MYHAANAVWSVPPMVMSSRLLSMVSAVALFANRNMTEDAVTPRTLTICASRGVKQPDEYGESAALITAVARANVLPVHEHSIEEKADPPHARRATSVQVAAKPQFPPLVEGSCAQAAIEVPFASSRLAGGRLQLSSVLMRRARSANGRFAEEP